MNGTKSFLKSKTFWFNVLAVIATIAGAFGYSGEVPSGMVVFLPAIIALINLALRFATNQGLSL